MMLNAMVEVLPTVIGEPFISDGDSSSVCTAAVRHVAPNDSLWDGVVIDDVTFAPDVGGAHWLFCQGELGTSGIGAVVLWSENSRDWRLADLGFGFVMHAGDAVDTVAFDSSRAAVTYDTLVGEDHDHAWTSDGGQTWTRVSSVE
jgi:hypothetical protein